MPKLVLSRKLNQSIWIADGEIKIKVIRVSGGQVKLLIEADADIPVVREELVEHQVAT